MLNYSVAELRYTLLYIFIHLIIYLYTPYYISLYTLLYIFIHLIIYLYTPFSMIFQRKAVTLHPKIEICIHEYKDKRI